LAAPPPRRGLCRRQAPRGRAPLPAASGISSTRRTNAARMSGTCGARWRCRTKKRGSSGTPATHALKPPASRRDRARGAHAIRTNGACCTSPPRWLVSDDLTRKHLVVARAPSRPPAPLAGLAASPRRKGVNRRFQAESNTYEYLVALFDSITNSSQCYSIRLRIVPGDESTIRFDYE